MQTALHIAAITAEARRELNGAEFFDSAFYRKERAAWMFFKTDKKKFALGMLFHPQAHGCLVVPAGKVRVETGEKPFPFFQSHYGATISQIEQLDYDRVIRLTLSGAATGAIIIEALGPSGNLWLLDAAGGRRQVLRHRDFSDGEPYQLPGAGARLSPLELDTPALRNALTDSGKTFAADALSKTVSGFDDTLSREALSRADFSAGTETATLSLGDCQRLCDAVTALARLAQNPDNGYLYSSTRPPSAQPFKLKSVDAQPDKHPSVSLAGLALAQSRKMQSVAADEDKKVTQAAHSALKRQARVIEKIEADISEAENFERYREIADILKANLHQLKRGMESVSLDDLYGDTTVTIELDPKLDGPENADRYYKRYQKGREGLETLTRRLEVAQSELGRLQTICAALDEAPESARERYAEELAALRKQRESAEPGEKSLRLPYRTYTTTTGLQIFVGRDGTDNDDTTFKHIKPYELWFHAAQCPGSHVGLKFPNKDFTPSKREIEETAALAAWFSKARNSATVPVNYTERKYVRKPRKAKPGLVTIERERTVMVRPTAPSSE
ncbi:MAG TPA: NFACT family protein [candidate division Zixibacteria bacterium]|nr:NFACT family protein [candidate division Zixibacteria bacterium]